MKPRFNKWTSRLTATALLIAGLLLIIVLNPALAYIHKTPHNNLNVFHNAPLPPAAFIKLNEAVELLNASELYAPTLRLDICLNDGSLYPALIQAVCGPAFAWGFYDKVVLQGNAGFLENHVELNGHKWNLLQLAAHEMTHCLQFQALGFWRSKPVADIPNWKWEGYAEYVSRQNPDQRVLSKNIARFLAADKSNWAVTFADGTISPRSYYDHWMLVQYCMTIKHMTYRQILADNEGEEAVRQEMMSWYDQHK